jgi:hypothetical protein
MPKQTEEERKRLRFPGSDSPVQPIREEKLGPQKEADDDYPEDDDEAEPAPEYKREAIGVRIGDSVETRVDAEALAEELDKEETIALIFSKPLKHQDRGFMHTWGAGIHLVPVSVALDKNGKLHWWLKSNKVRRAADPRKTKSAA